MNTQWKLRVRLCVLAAAGLALAGIGAPVLADAQGDMRPVTPLNGWNGKMGPGLGSVKTPFGVVEIGRLQSSESDDVLYFHTSTGQAADQTPVQRLGPGLWSSKSPFSVRADSNTPW